MFLNPGLQRTLVIHHPQSLGGQDRLGALDSLARDKKPSAFASVTSRGPIGSVFSPDGKWLAYGITTDASHRGCESRRLRATVPGHGRSLPSAAAISGLPSSVVGIGRGARVHGGGDRGQMAAVGVATATAGEVTFGTPVRFPASVTGDRPSNRAAGLGHPAGRAIHRHRFRHRGRDAEFAFRASCGAELVRGIEAAGSGSIAEGDAKHHGGTLRNPHILHHPPASNAS